MSVGLGILGCGRIVRRVHLPALAGVPDLRVVAIAEPDAARRAEAARLVPGAHACAGIDELLGDAAVEAVLVATPSHLHEDAAVAVLSAGRHVYLEKPLAHDVGAGRRIVDAWRSAGVVGMAGFNYRFDPLYAELRARLGAVVALQSAFTTRPRDLPDWKRARSTGGGALLDLGSHHLDLIRFLLRTEIEAVQATFSSRTTEDDTVALSVATAAGVPAQILAAIGSTEHDGFAAFTAGERIVVDRQARTITVETPPTGWGPGARAGRAARRLRQALTDAAGTLRPPVQPSYGHAFRAFARAVRGEIAPPVDLADGLANLLAIDAAERSRSSRRLEPVEPA